MRTSVPPGTAVVCTGSQMRSTMARPRPRIASADGIARPKGRSSPSSTTSQTSRPASAHTRMWPPPEVCCSVFVVSSLTARVSSSVRAAGMPRASARSVTKARTARRSSATA